MTNRIENNSINFNNFENNLLKISIKERQQFICNQFSQFYKDQNYSFIPPDNLLPNEDKSVIFTGATITPLKKKLFEGITSPGYFVVQKCLRTQGLNTICDLDVIPSGVNYFTMCGILASPERREDVSVEGYNFLVNNLGICKENILIKACSNDKELFKPWKDMGITVEEDTKEDFYNWKYGISNIYGRGVSILLRFNENDTFNEIGNQIIIYDDTKKAIGHEFGFGVESLLSKMTGLKKSTESNTVSMIIPYKEGIQEKFVNTLITCVVLYHNGIEPGQGKEKFILKKHIKGLSFLRREFDISIDQIKKYSDAYERIEFETFYESGNRLVKGIIAYESQLLKFFNYADNQIHAHLLRGKIDQYMVQKIIKQGEISGILLPEINKIINKIYEIYPDLNPDKKSKNIISGRFNLP